MHVNASLDEIAAYLDDLLKVQNFASEPGANGLIARAGAGVSKFAVAVNTSLTTIVGAAKTGAQLLVVHHPSWPEVDLALHDEKMQALAAGGISLYAAHASLDCAPEIGNPSVLARLFGLRPGATFGEFHGGHAGVLCAHDGTFAELIATVSRTLGVQAEAHEHAKTCGRVAIMTGAGGMTADMAAAQALGADTYLTGEGSMFTRLYAREAGMSLIFGTHQATEAPGIRALGERLAAETQLPWEFIPDSADVF